MAGRRRWGTWLGRTAQELNVVSGVAGVGGTIASIASWTVFSGVTAVVLSGGGAAIALGAFGYAVWKATPPVMKRPEELVGRPIPLNELADVWPRIPTIAIVGPSMAGKTTLKSRLSFRPTPHERTQTVTAYVISLPTSPQRYVALLDGGGEQFAQQFRIAEPAEYLCVVADHNSSDTDSAIDQRRVDAHAEFFRQIRGHLVESNSTGKERIEILVNKRDLWQSAPKDQRDAFERFWTAEERQWKDGRFGKIVALKAHSNEIPDDIAKFAQILQDSVTN
jgi:hypothetical protein